MDGSVTKAHVLNAAALVYLMRLSVALKEILEMRTGTKINLMERGNPKMAKASKKKKGGKKK